MARAIKLKNNDYFDTKGIVHNKQVLSDVISKQNAYACLIKNQNQTITMTADWQWRDVNMNNTYQWNGGTYLINDGNGLSISIGENVSEIEVIGWLTYNAVNTDSALEVHIMKNGTSTGVIGFHKCTNGYTQTVIIPTSRITVNKGDKISMGIIAGSLRSISIYSDSGRPSTGFAIKIIR